MRHGAAAAPGPSRWALHRSSWASWAQRVWCLGLAVAILGPALAPGYTLSYDMVFVPHLDLGRDALGLGDALPRAVPVDAVVALLSSVAPGQVVQKLVLLATLVAAGLGAARLTPTRSTGLRAVAATAYVWNPYVAERLVLGHWALLVTYAALPWLVLAVSGVRAGQHGAGPRAVLLGAAAALTPTGGVLAALVALPILLWPGGRRRWPAAVGGLCVLALNAPWWLPGLVHGGGGDGSRAGVEAFAARGENVLGTVGSLLTLGGVWNAQVVPDSRGTLLGVLATLLFLGLGMLGLKDLRAGLPPPALGGLVVAAGVGAVVAVLAVLPGGTDALAWLIDRVPGAGLLRDAQKWLAPYAVLLAPAVALGVGRLASRVRDADLRRLVPAAAIVALLVCLPDLVWGAAGRLGAVNYPGEWSQVRATLTAARDHGARGDVLVLPWSAFRAFDWNGDRTVLDPAPRWLPGSVVASDDLVVRRSRRCRDRARGRRPRHCRAGRPGRCRPRPGPRTFGHRLGARRARPARRPRAGARRSGGARRPAASAGAARRRRATAVAQLFTVGDRHRHRCRAWPAPGCAACRAQERRRALSRGARVEPARIAVTRWYAPASR